MFSVLAKFVVILLITKYATSFDDQLRLFNDLLGQKYYNEQIIPAVRTREPLLLYMNLSLIQIIDVEEKNEFISIRVWVNQEWNDPNYVWDPKDYGNITKIHIPSKNIWTPDLVLYNNAGGDWDLSKSNTKVTVHFDGSVFWKPPIIFKIQCEINVEYFPFDSQTCSLKIGTWSHHGSLIDLRHTAQKSNLLKAFDNCERFIDYAIDLSNFQDDVEWDIIDVRAKRHITYYSCCTQPYLDIRFNVTLRRKILFYGVNLICPCLAISFLTVLVFYLPADSNEKISLSINVLINLTVFFLLIFDISPPTSLVVPLILKYLLFTMTLITLSVLMTIIVLNIHWRSPETNIITQWVRTVFTITLPTLLFMAKPETVSLDNFSENKKIGFGEICFFNKSFGSDICEESTDNNSSQKNDFIFELHENDMNLDLPKWRQRRQAVTGESAVSEIQLALEGSRKIVNHIKKKEKYRSMRGDWKYIALVLDRLFLCIFSVASIIGMLGIFMQSPTLTDGFKPLTSRNVPQSNQINVTRLGCN